MQVKLINATPKGEQLIAYCARVSSPNQDNPEYEGLLRYCVKHGHWSVFEMADMTVEIITSRAIAAQILRHKSFSFQELSQRYSAVTEFETIEARRQDTKNRQNSIDDLSEQDKAWFLSAQSRVINEANNVYRDALDRGIAKECARMVLPLLTQTRLYMKGSVRSWIHYLAVRDSPDTQLEHRLVAQAAKQIFCEQFPVVGLLI
jgi:thymidylate synthase (FAD)